MSLDKLTIIESKNLHLRIPSKDDFQHIFSATRYKGFNDGMPWNPPENVDELMAPYKRGIQAWEEGIGYNFTIENKETDEFFGRISIRKMDEKDRWNIGFWTHPEHQKKGIMTEAVAAILEFGFQKLSAKK